jgi:hypothetical protein
MYRCTVKFFSRSTHIVEIVKSEFFKLEVWFLKRYWTYSIYVKKLKKFQKDWKRRTAAKNRQSLPSVFGGFGLKGIVAWYGFLTIASNPRYRGRILQNFNFGPALAPLSVFVECAKIFQQPMRTFLWSIFQHCEMAYYIRALREQNAMRIFCLPDRRCHSAYSPYALSELNICPNSVNISTTWKKFKILSFYPT